MITPEKIMDRYSRQVILKEIGEEGQGLLLNSDVTVVGCGALGTVIANNLTRAGIGKIQLVDRDLVEMNNLQRQMLFDEKDIGRPKAVVCAEKLSQINSEIEIIPTVVDLNFSNIEKIIENCDLVVDGTDNMETRFLINDASVKKGIPWIYGGAIETHGMTMNIIPNETPCFRCIVPQLPKAGTMPTCDTVGVLNMIPVVIGSIESLEAIKILLGKEPNKNLQIYDIWNHKYDTIFIEKNDNCECCGKHNFEFLNAEKKEIIMPICGSDAVQITPIRQGNLNLDDLAHKLQKLGKVEVTDIVVKFKTDKYELMIFSDARVIINGTSDNKIAKSLYAKYIGS